MGEEGHEVFVFIKRKRGLPSAEKHPLSPPPPCLALSEGFAYLSDGGREVGSWEVGSRESNYGRVRARFLPGKGWAQGVQSNTRTGQVHPGRVSTFLTAFPHRVPTHSVLSPRPL